MFRHSKASATFVALLMALCASTAALATNYYDPPGRVARLSDSRGGVSFSQDGGDQWYDLRRNQPLNRGDQLWTDRGARAELQVGSAVIRLDQETNLEFLELDDRLVQVQVSEGAINLRVKRLYPGQTIEVDTPNLAFVINRPGRYRIDVDYQDDATTLVTWQGSGVVYGVGSRFSIRAGDTLRFWGDDLRDYEAYGLPRTDSFDRYCYERDRRLDRSVSLRYLGDDVIGYSDLDDYGRWNSDPRYGNVWYPDQVDSDWAPYRDGEWIWQDRYDWTWVDDEPWGFAPSHYGRWAYIDGRWGWIPGPRNYRAVYAPALVVFLGGGGSGLSIGWFPLGPRDVYMPSYPVSQNYFTQVNVSNTVVNNTTIINNYNIYNSGDSRPRQASFANRAVTNAVTVVPRDVFVNSRPVRQAAQRGDRNLVERGTLSRIAPVGTSSPAKPVASPIATTRPPRELRNREVFARNPPPVITRPRMNGQMPQPSSGQAGAPAEPGNGQQRRRNVRVLPAQANAVDARAAGPKNDVGTPAAAPAATPAAAPAALAPLDRTVEPKARRHRPGQNAAPASTPPGQAAAPVAQPEAALQPAQRDAQAAREQAQKDAQAQRDTQAAAREQARKDAQAQRDAQAASEQAQKDAQARRDAQAAARAEAQAAREQAQKDAQAQREAQAAREKAERDAESARGEGNEPPPAESPPNANANDNGNANENGKGRCVTSVQIERMKKRGMTDEQIGKLTPCPAVQPPEEPVPVPNP